MVKTSRKRLFSERYVHFRPIEDSDIKYLYAGWVKNKGDLGIDDFQIPNETNKEDFAALFPEFVRLRYQVAYSFEAESLEGRHVVGIAFLIQPIPDKDLLIMGDMVWFPWASDRNKLETMVHFMNVMRKDWTILEFAQPKDGPFFDHVCRYGVMRRVGNIIAMQRGDPVPMYQTRRLRSKDIGQ